MTKDKDIKAISPINVCTTASRVCLAGGSNDCAKVNSPRQTFPRL